MPRHTKKCREKWVIRTYGFYYCPVHDSIIDWEEEFIDGMKRIWANEGFHCTDCRHFDGHFSCPAFPKVIPSPYLSGEEIHRKSNKYLQKNNIVFTPKEIKCPKCQSENTIPIVYGYPSPKGMKKAERGEIKLGGCCIGKNDPQWYCKNCKEEFGKIKRINKGDFK